MSESSLMSREEKIKKIVDEMMNEKNDNPFDSTFQFLNEFHPKETHMSLRFPGMFVEDLKTEVFTFDNRNRRMDSAHKILQDDVIPCTAVINTEHQHYPLTDEKKDILYQYKLYLTIKYKLPALSVIVTNIGDGDKTEIFESHGDAFKVYFRVFTNDEIRKRLNTLTDKVNNNQKLSTLTSLDFGFILLFAQKPYAKSYTEKVVKLFKNVKNLDSNLQLDLHHVLKKLIRAHFKDDEIKTRELLTMITEAISPELLDKLPTFQKLINNLQMKDDEITRKDQVIKEKDNKLTLKDQEIIEKDNKLTLKDQEITEKNQEITRLKQKLTENNIKY